MTSPGDATNHLADDTANCMMGLFRGRPLLVSKVSTISCSERDNIPSTELINGFQLYSCTVCRGEGRFSVSCTCIIQAVEMSTVDRA